MKKILTVLIVCGVAAAGMKIGGRIGYYDGDDPRTRQSASGAVFGGQITFPLLGLVDLEISGSYAGSESDISMQQYLVTYLDDEYGLNFEDDTTGLSQYLEDEWGWSPDSLETELFSDYTATFHDIDLGATMKVKIPIGALPLRPYIGGGAGAHILFSDADVLLQVASQQTGGQLSIDPYDKVHPGVHGIIGAAFEPPAVPISFFGEYKYTKPLGGEDVGGISMVYFGVNLGF
ncbi:MAG: hypothetical protein AVO35_12865 [Candidatus Aegiribacteria sp. MLS_C]|nr:MAG: hypothetical protein AVO35_12865 [Candidatus Aegiribacteria sp. MLS_C]